MTPHFSRQVRTVVCALVLAAGIVPATTGCAPVDGCSQTSDTATGLTISKGFIVGSMHLACTTAPDAFDFTIILVHNGQMTEPGKNFTHPPDTAGYDAAVFAPCAPGTWHVYYLATWSLGGQTAHNDTTTLEDEQVVPDDC